MESLIAVSSRTSSWLRATLTAGAMLVLAARADAAMTFCLQDENSVPLRRVWVRTGLVDGMTSAAGCVTYNGSNGPIDITVYAQNPVMRMVDGGNSNFAVSQDLTGVRNGDVLQIPAQQTFWRIAERFRDAYDDGLRQLPPWNGAEFPAATDRDPLAEGVYINIGVLRASWPDESLAVRAWTEGAALVGALGHAGFPLVHLFDGDETDLGTIRHELGHALHFARVSNTVRNTMEITYGLWLAGQAENDRAHCFDKRTNAAVAWIEAFGFLAEDFAAAPGTGSAKRSAFFDRAAIRRLELLDGTVGCEAPNQTTPSFGADTEGAVYLTLFYDFARQPSIGLDFVVESYVSCQSSTLAGYASCIQQRHASNPAIYAALLAAASCNNIVLPGGGPQQIADASESSDHFGAALARGDFNGDGLLDLAVGVPGEKVGSASQAGLVNVIYGLPSGLSARCNQSFTQSTPGVPGGPEADDHLGQALAAGDFDRDGFTDLAVGIPGEDVDATANAGAVLVVHGTLHGLDTGHAKLWTMANLSPQAPPFAPGANDNLGAALAAGDFDHRPQSNPAAFDADDLAIGVPGAGAGGLEAGAVMVIYGRLDNGLDVLSTQRLLQPASPEPFDYFGSSLAAGDLDGDGFADLAAGAPGEDGGAQVDSGAVSVFYGGVLRFMPTAARTFTQGAGGLAGQARWGDQFGASLAFGDFDGNGLVDLAAGAPGDDLGSAYRAGVVDVVFGAAARTGNVGSQHLTAEAVGGAALDDAFGAALVAGDFDSNGVADLAVGAPNQDAASVADAGAVIVFPGFRSHFEVQVLPSGQIIRTWVPGGLDSSQSEAWTQNSGGIGDVAESGDRLGASLAAADFNADGIVDLAIGVPSEDVGSVAEAGAVTVVRGSGTGLTATGDQLWHQDR